MSRMTLAEEPEFTARYPEEYNCAITVTGRNGESHTARGSWPKGHRSNPMSNAEVEKKFRSFAGISLSESQCGQALETLWEFETLPDLRPLFDRLTIT